MKKIVVGMIMIVILAVAAGVVISADKGQGYYVCNCKDDCKCTSISKEPGKCACGKELVGMHMLAIENNTAVLCRCGTECKCERNAKDPNLCGCGKPVKKVNITGKFVCACDGCKCNTVSDKPGKCNCGKEMKKI